MSNKFTVEDAKREAEAEIKRERMAAAKTKLKAKLIEIDDTEQVLKNLRRELDELEHELAEGIQS
jgi:hypothetical protein